MALTPVVFSFGNSNSSGDGDSGSCSRDSEGDDHNRFAIKGISTHIRQLQEQLQVWIPLMYLSVYFRSKDEKKQNKTKQYQPAFVPQEGPPSPTSPHVSSSPGPQLHVRKRQLAIQLGSELTRRQDGMSQLTLL